jgi:hypothetical protein
VHAEPASAYAFAAVLKQRNIEATVGQRGVTVTL